ncbi:hypothetical protein ACH6CV_05140 [Bacillota bacterium Meth-B3]
MKANMAFPAFRPEESHMVNGLLKPSSNFLRIPDMGNPPAALRCSVGSFPQGQFPSQGDPSLTPMAAQAPCQTLERPIPGQSRLTHLSGILTQTLASLTKAGKYKPCIIQTVDKLEISCYDMRVKVKKDY